MISTSNNTSELSFALEESINLINWHTNQLIDNVKFLDQKSFSKELIKWFKKNRREMPWRKNPSLYRVYLK